MPTVSGRKLLLNATSVSNLDVVALNAGLSIFTDHFQKELQHINCLNGAKTQQHKSVVDIITRTLAPPPPHLGIRQPLVYSVGFLHALEYVLHSNVSNLPAAYSPRD